MRRAAVAAVAAAIAVGACAPGTPSPDLFVVERSGSGPGARLTLLVSDTSVRCNGKPAVDLSSEQIITARALLDDLEEFDADDSKPRIPTNGELFTFSVRSEFGRVRFADRATEPDVFPQIARFTRTVAQDLCGLER